MIRTYRMIWEILTPRERRRYLTLFCLMIVMSIFEVLGVAIIFPFLKVISDPAFINENWLLAEFKAFTGLTEDIDVTIAIGLAVFAVITLGMAIRALASYAEIRFGLMRAYTIGSRLLEGYIRQPYAFFLTRNSSDFGQNLLSELDLVIRESILPAVLLVSAGLVALLISVFLFVMQPYVALGATVLLVTVYLGVYRAARGFLGRTGEARFQANLMRFRVVNEAMGGIKELKLAGLEDEFLRRFAEPAHVMAQQQTLGLVLGRLPRFALETVIYGGFILMLIIMVMTKSEALQDALPTFGLIGMAGMKLFPALQAIYNNLASIRYSHEALDNLHASVVQLARVETNEVTGPTLRLAKALELRDVSFRYPGSETLTLDRMSLTIPAHSSCGIVGGTGAGRTTVIDLILGLLRPSEGALLVDGAVLSDDEVRAWQKGIGYVPQSIYLSDATVAENIAFGVSREKIDMAAVERAARIANLHDFVISDLPHGYETTVGERGIRLSGGQRQRIGIARALYYDPDILILDEATSALDNLTERAVMEAVTNLGRAKTVVMIAHRLTTVKDCDTIFFLNQGKLEVQGSYDELLASSAAFRKLAEV